MDLEILHKRIGANGRLGFASADLVRCVLGIEPGALTPLALLNGEERLVTVVIDAGLVDVSRLNFHPPINTRSTGLKSADLVVFITSRGRDPVISELGAMRRAG